MKKTIVIVTHSDDNASVEQVSERIKASGRKVLRLNSDQYPTEFQLQAEIIDNRQQHHIITPSGDSTHTDDIHAIWYRRMAAGKNIDAQMESQMRAASVEESRRCLLGLLTCTDCFQVDEYWRVKKASNKDYQLKLAANIGLELPKTLVTNSEDAARRFYDENQGQIITKMQTAFSVWKNGSEQVVFTNDVEAHHLDNLEGLRQCPMVFQEKVKKKLELRVTVVGKQVFCAAIDSNAHAQMQTDWRKRGQDTLEDWFIYPLPEEIQQKVLQLTRNLGLNYGAIDIIVTPDNRYTFLEINPCGEFFWMDYFTNLPICDAMADLLVNGHHNMSNE